MDRPDDKPPELPDGVEIHPPGKPGPSTLTPPPGPPPPPPPPGPPGVGDG